MSGTEGGYTRDVWVGRNLQRAVLAALVVVLALGAFAAAIVSRGDRPFQVDVARALADRSDAVAASLARGDRCAADRDADRLRADSVAAVRGDLVSLRIARELLARTSRLANSIACPPPAGIRPPASPPASVPRPRATTPPPGDHHGHGEGRGKDRGEGGRGKKRGHHHGDEDG